MLKRIFRTMIFALLASASGWPVSAKTIDAFLADYESAIVIEFSGVVEPDGVIQLTDLTDISFRATLLGGTVLPKSDFSLFSYNTTGGPSSLDFIVSDPAVPVLACGGASIALFAPCNDFGRVSTSSTVMIFTVGPLSSSILPTITRLSSTPVPEPRTWTMLLMGFLGVGFAGALVRGRGARQL